MIEAKITCLCRDISLTDWSLNLVEGEVAWVSASEARSSEELQRCVRNKALKLEYVERVRKMNKNAPTPNLFSLGRRVVTKSRWASDASPGDPIAPTSPPSSVESALLREIRSLRQTCERLADAVESLAEQQIALPQALQSALEGMSVAAPQIVTVVEAQHSSPQKTTRGKVDAEPVFIPSGLVDKTQSVSVESAADETAELGDSIAQLRALRGRKARQDEE